MVLHYLNNSGPLHYLKHLKGITAKKIDTLQKSSSSYKIILKKEKKPDVWPQKKVTESHFGKNSQHGMWTKGKRYNDQNITYTQERK